jgi:hypothetical protein
MTHEVHLQIRRAWLVPPDTESATSHYIRGLFQQITVYVSIFCCFNTQSLHGVACSCPDARLSVEEKPRRYRSSPGLLANLALHAAVISGVLAIVYATEATERVRTRDVREPSHPRNLLLSAAIPHA